MRTLAITAVLGLAGSALAMPTFDGSITGAEWGTPLAVQDTPTGFGNATGGGQDSAGGGELNAAYGSISGGTLNFAITGNIEANFNKLWIFIDAVAGGESVLANDNTDGGFGEINNLAGTAFDAGFEPDHGIRVELGGGFLGVNGFDLIDNTASSIWSGAGTGDLPLVGAAGGLGTTVGWDNSNTLGVDGASAAGALTATTGFEFSIDMATFFGATPSEVRITAIYGNGDGGFLSNQVLGGIGGGGNLGGSPDFTAIAGDQFFTVVPAPGAAAFMGLAGFAGLRRRR